MGLGGECGGGSKDCLGMWDFYTRTSFGNRIDSEGYVGNLVLERKGIQQRMLEGREAARRHDESSNDWDATVFTESAAKPKPPGKRA
jgi:hypothetical protein